MKQKQDIDWVKALADLQAAKKRKQGVPPWLWGIIPFLVLGFCTYAHKEAKKAPKPVSPPAWAVAGQNAAIGKKVTFTSDTWGYSSQDLLTEACRAAGRHAETFAQYNRDTFRQGKACPMYKGEDCKVVDKASNWGDVYLRVRREGTNRAWWVLATEVE